MKHWSNAAEILWGFLILGAVLFFVASPSKNQLLLRSVASGDIAQVRKFIDQGADLNRRTGEVKKTALMISAANGNQEITKLLLKYGADPNIKDRNGRTAYDYAKDRGQTNVIELLVPKDSSSVTNAS